MDREILAKLQRHRGYRGWRIRPYSLNAALWMVETSIWLGHGNAKGWRVLRDDRDNYRTFRTPEQAYEAWLSMQQEFDDLQRLFNEPE